MTNVRVKYILTYWDTEITSADKIYARKEHIMYYYKLYGFYIATDVKFEQLIEEDFSEACDKNVITIVEGDFPDQYRQMEPGYDFLDGKSAVFSNSCCYMYFKNNSSIVYEKKKGAEQNLLKSYILGWGMSIIGIMRGLLSIHCAALADNDGAILISGSSGSGKSTITTQLLNRGYRLVADDMALVDAISDEKPYAFPAFPYNKLCRDAALSQGYDIDELIYIDEDRDKYFVPCKDNFSTEKVPIKSIIMLTLNDKENVFKEEITGVKKMYACMDTLFLNGIHKDKKCGYAVGNMCLKLASKTPVYHVSRPYGKDTTKEVLQAIMDFVNLKENE